MNKYLEKIAATAETDSKKPGVGRHLVTAGVTGAGAFAGHRVGNVAGAGAGLAYGLRQMEKAKNVGVGEFVGETTKSFGHIAKGAKIGRGIGAVLGGYGAYRLARPSKG